MKSTLDHPISESKTEVSKSTQSSMFKSEPVNPQKLDKKASAPAFPFQLDVGEPGFNSDTSGDEVTLFFPKSTTTGAIIKSGCSGIANVSSSVCSKGDNTHLERFETDEEVVYSQRAKLFRISSNGKLKEQSLGDIQILRDSSTGARR